MNSKATASGTHCSTLKSVLIPRVAQNTSSCMGGHRTWLNLQQRGAPNNNPSEFCLRLRHWKNVQASQSARSTLQHGITRLLEEAKNLSCLVPEKVAKSVQCGEPSLVKVVGILFRRLFLFDELDRFGFRWSCDCWKRYFGLIIITESAWPVPSSWVAGLDGSISPTPSTRNL